MVCPSESSGWFRCPRSCFCYVKHLCVSSSCASCSRGACFRKAAGARKPRRVAAFRLHSDWFRWAKHDDLVNDRQSSMDCCIVRDVTEIFSVADALVPPLPPEQPVLGSGISICVALLWCCQQTLVLGRCDHFARADSTHPVHKSLPQSCAVPGAGVASTNVCQSRCSLCFFPVATMAVHSFGRDKSIGHRCCRHCSKSRPRSPGSAVKRLPFGF